MNFIKSLWETLIAYSEELYEFRQRYHKTTFDRYL